MSDSFIEFKKGFLEICLDRGVPPDEVKAKSWYSRLIKVYSLDEIKYGISYFLMFSKDLNNDYGHTKKFPSLTDFVQAIDKAINRDTEKTAKLCFLKVCEIIQSGERYSEFEDINLAVNSICRNGWYGLGKELNDYNFHEYERRFIQAYVDKKDRERNERLLGYSSNSDSKLKLNYSLKGLLINEL